MGLSPITISSSYFDAAILGQSIQPSFQQQSVQLSETQITDTQDTVDISQLAQVQQMALQGESTSLIASTTGLTVSEVDSDLGITDTTSSSSVSIDIPSGHGGGQSAAADASAPTATVAANAATSISKAATHASTLSVRA